jgi:hypothetical protein
LHRATLLPLLLGWYVGDDNNWDLNNPNFRIDIWPLGASSSTTLLGNNGLGSALNQFSEAVGGLTEDVKGNIYVSDAAYGRILKYQRTVDIDTLYTPTDPGQYYAVVTDVQGCTETTPTINVITPDPDPASITISATATSAAVCTPITFTAAAAHAGASPDFQWEVSGVKVGKDSDSYTNNLFANGDQVFCVLTSPYACSLGPGGDTSNIITLSIDPHGTATVAIAASDTAVCIGSPVTFEATVTNGATQPTFQWLLNGNPISGDDTAAYHTDSLADDDVITCVITSDNACGLAKSNSIHMFVSVPPSIVTGQVFTIKYGDSLTLNPEISGNIISFNWTPAAGLSDSTVFHVHDVAPGDRAHAWNGTFHGTPAPAGTYVYVVTMKLAGGNRQVYKGTVMLIR